jgi:alpha-tubulin suppressor-like RCC1 family protein
LSSQAIEETHENLAENIVGLLTSENLVRLETAIKSTYIFQIACGSNHALLLTSSGFVYSMGSNEFGQLGNPSDDLSSTANA